MLQQPRGSDLVNWLQYSILATFCLALQAVLLQVLSRLSQPAAYMAICWAGAGLTLALLDAPATYFALKTEAPLLMLGGLFSWAGMYAYTRAISRQPNLGFVEAVSSGRTIFVYLIAVLFLNGRLDLRGGVGVLLGVGGVLVLALPRSAHRADFAPGIVRGGWFGWSICSATAFACLIWSTTLAVQATGSAISATAVILATGSIGFFLELLLMRQLASLWGLAKRAVPALGAAVVVSAVGNAALFASLNGAQNAAFPAAISGSRAALLYLYALALRHDSPTVQGALGVLLMMTSVVAVS
jgi:uncharacterized membrane protein